MHKLNSWWKRNSIFELLHKMNFIKYLVFIIDLVNKYMLESPTSRFLKAFKPRFCQYFFCDKNRLDLIQ